MNFTPEAQRHLQLERVLAKIAWYEAWERAVTQGVRIGDHMPDDPPLGGRERDQLAHLDELRDVIRGEMIDAKSSR